MNRKYPGRPIPGVGSTVFRNNKVLLIKRGNPPLKDTWSLPGGAVHPGEDLMHAVKREIREECGIEIDVLDLITLFEYIEMEDTGAICYHYIVFDFASEYLSGRLRHASDAHDARWVPLDRLNQYKLTDEVRKAINEGLKLIRTLKISASRSYKPAHGITSGKSLYP